MAAETHGNIRDLVQEAQTGNRKAYEELYLKYRMAIRGYISSRVFDADTIKDVEQATWTLVLERMSSFNPDRMAFYSFVKYKAMFIIRRHYRHPEIPVSELKKLFPDCETDTEIIDLIATTDPGQLRMSEEEQMDAAMLITRTIFSLDRPPHQIIAFAFNSLLEYGPKRIVKELLEIPLRDLCTRLQQEYEETARRVQISPHLRRLKRMMIQKIEDITVGEATLRDFCGIRAKKDYQRRAEAKISDWDNKVFMSVRRAILSTHGCCNNEDRTS